MDLYPPVLVLHILSAVVWLGTFPAQLIIEKFLKGVKGTPAEAKMVSLYLFLLNIAGMIGMIGILLSGIFMVFILPYYSFFSFASNHWLAAKQVLMIVIAFVIFAVVIPKGKKAKSLLKESGDEPEQLGSEFYAALDKVSKAALTANILVLINFLLAITHRFIN